MHFVLSETKCVCVCVEIMRDEWMQEIAATKIIHTYVVQSKYINMKARSEKKKNTVPRRSDGRQQKKLICVKADEAREKREIMTEN